MLKQLTKKCGKIIRRYRFELICLGGSIFFSLAGLAYYVVVTNSYLNEVEKKVQNSLSISASQVEKVDDVDENPQNDRPKKLFVDISGGVVSAGVYEFENEARFVEVVEKAGGLSKDADLTYFSLKFNQASLLQDGQKIHIPTKVEVANGLFKYDGGFESDSGSLDADRDGYDVTNETQSSSQAGIDVNVATLAELDSLPEVGPVTAQKIIDGRPYETAEDLKTKKVLTEKQLESMRDLIYVGE